MRGVVQRVQQGCVWVEDKIVGKIEKGLVIFLAITSSDTEKDLEYILEKTVGLRVFSDEQDKMNRSLMDVKGELLVISQFTLYGDVRKGKRPNFTASAGAEQAMKFYSMFVQKAREKGIKTETGMFGEHMKVEILNDGPVTIQIDSTKLY